MKSKLKFLMMTTFLSLTQIFAAYADLNLTFGEDSKNLMANRLLAGILSFLQNCAFIMFAFALGMFVYSMKNEDGAKKTDSLKIFGVGLLLIALKTIASVVGLI